MRIPLSESKYSNHNTSIRVFADDKMPFLLANLLSAVEGSNYKQACIEIRSHVRPKELGEDMFQCINPDWFDDYENKKIDYTTCSYCGYRKSCSIELNEYEYLEIVPIGDARIPSENFMREHVLFPKASTSRTNPDPFFGFSMRAGNTRKLYLMTQEMFEKTFPNNSTPQYFLDASIGYEMPTGKAFWPIDQQFLEIYEQMSVQISEFDVPGKHGIDHGDLNSFDRASLVEIAMMNGWISGPNDDAIDELDLLCSRLIRVLKGRSLKTFFKKLGNIQISPVIDVPYFSSGSGYFILALRWIELRPNDISNYIESLADEPNQKRHCNTISKIFSQANVHLGQGEISHYPRFPAIAITPSQQLSEIRLEQSACRVIDVVEYEGVEKMLLLDGLGINLSEVI
jgi:hypothetical protein